MVTENIRDQIQKDAVLAMNEFYSSNRLGYLNMAMRMGKTKIVMDFLRTYHPTSKVLISYPDNLLKNSWEEHIEKYGSKSSVYILTNKRSLDKYVNSEFDFFVIDEFHNMSENQINAARAICDTSKYVLCLSGTVDFTTRMIWADFKEIYRFTQDMSIECNITSDYRVYIHVVELDNKLKIKQLKNKMVTEKELYDWYSRVIEYNDLMGRDTKFMRIMRNRVSLESISKRKYVVDLMNKMYNKRLVIFTGIIHVAESFGIPYYHSKCKDSDSLERFQSGEFNHIAFASMGKVGMTFKNIDSVIIMNPTYNAKDTAQISMRCTQLDYNGKIGNIHIIAIDEADEINKIKRTLKLLNENKIDWIYNVNC